MAMAGAIVKIADELTVFLITDFEIPSSLARLSALNKKKNDCPSTRAIIAPTITYIIG